MAVWMAAWVAFAQEPKPVDPTVARAEYVRLSDELKRAAQRNAWKGVERHYGKALATGATVNAEDHVLGARSARHRGDLGAVRERLVRAIAAQPTLQEAIDEVASLDASYARVDLRASVGAVLEDYERPFDPLKLKAVDFAIATMKETGRFDGLLPPGPYALNADPFELAAGQVFSLDLTPAEPPVETSVPIWKR